MANFNNRLQKLEMRRKPVSTINALIFVDENDSEEQAMQAWIQNHQSGFSPKEINWIIVQWIRVKP